MILATFVLFSFIFFYLCSSVICFLLPAGVTFFGSKYILLPSGGGGVLTNIPPHLNLPVLPPHFTWLSMEFTISQLVLFTFMFEKGCCFFIGGGLFLPGIHWLTYTMLWLEWVVGTILISFISLGLFVSTKFVCFFVLSDSELIVSIEFIIFSISFPFPILVPQNGWKRSRPCTVWEVAISSD